MMRGKWLAVGALCIFILTACSTPKNFNYLQDLVNGQEMANTIDGSIRLQPKDQVTIYVKSKDGLTSALFNKGINTNIKEGKTEGNMYMTGYTLGPDGTIDFPVIGKIPLKGLTRYEAEQTIQAKLREEQLKDANVTMEFMNLSYTVTGEVNRPGVYPIEKDALTLFEALGQAQDVGIYGKRDSIMVVRDLGNSKKTYMLSLNSAKDLFSSEAYYIRQNDIIYVKSNNVKVRQSTSNGNETRNISFWLSIVSVLSTMALLIFK
jgi:polysaccharide export outer membrane protein